MSEQCIFCRIVRGEIPATRVLERERVIAFRDVNPQAPVHILVVPTEHVAGLTDLPGASPIWNDLLSAVQQVVADLGLPAGFRVVMNQGPDGGQTVDHLHLHVLGGRAFHWPPG